MNYMFNTNEDNCRLLAQWAFQMQVLNAICGKPQRSVLEVGKMVANVAERRIPIEVESN